jgi:acetyl esterase
MAWFSEEGAPGGLDPRIRAALDAQGPVPEFRTIPVAQVRADFDRLAARVPKQDEPLARVEDAKVAGRVPVRTYTPEGKGPFPTLVYFHGGGWVVGGLESHDGVCRSLARRAPATVVAVDYRLSPEARFPDALEDGRAVFEWASARGGPVAVGGDSAGGNLAAALALELRSRVASQLLVYPVTDASFDTASYREFASGYGLTRANMRWFWDCYLRTPADAADPRVSPLRATDFRGVARAFVMTCEFDVLRDEGEAYARRLHEAGVPVRCVRYRGMNHGCIRMGALYPRADRALSDLAAALRA